MLATRMAVSERGRICDYLISQTFTHLLLLFISRVVIAAIEGTRDKWMRVAKVAYRKSSGEGDTVETRNATRLSKI